MYTQLKKVLFVYLPLSLVFIQIGCKKEKTYPKQTLPAITQVLPVSGMVGTPVVIKGVNLKNVDLVRFGAVDAAGFTASSNTDTSIAVVVPAGVEVGDVYVQVYYKDGSGYNTAKFKVLATLRVPDITSSEPAIAFPGDEVLLKGTDLDVVSKVEFGSVIATPFTADPDKIKVKVPLNATGGKQLIKVTSVTGGTDTISFTVNLAPVITSVSPLNAVPGDLITVNGIRFTNVTSVKLGTKDALFTFVDDTKLTFTVPDGAVSEKVTVTTPNGSGTSASNIVIPVAGVKKVIYGDAIEGGFSKWGGWGGEADENNTSPVKSGAKSVKIHYAGQWGSPLQLGGANIDLTQYSTFKISIYGGPGTNGRAVNIGFNEKDGKTLTLTEGQWTNFEIPLSEITTDAAFTELWIKEYSNVSGVDEIIYVDDIGLN